MIRVGTAGWSYEDWKGIVYPQRRPRGFDRLGLHASLFDTNEINSTFYRIPDARMTRDWSRRVAGNPRFAFTAKLFRGFTHEREAGEAEAKALEAAMESLAADGRLGCILAQFPMSFRDTPENRGHLARLLERFARYPLAAEFRHASWDNGEVLKLLTERATAFVNIDQPALKGNLRPTSHATAEHAYFRFHGRNAAKWFGPDTSNVERYNYLYSEQELEPWVRRISKVSARNVFAILNNHFRGQAVSNALELQHALTAATPAVPETLRAAFPALAAVTTSAGAPRQKPLF